MAYITTDNNYITVLCSNCGQKLKVYNTESMDTNWCYYKCPYCGYISSIEDNNTSSEHRAYSLDEILEMNKKENSLNRIADALEDIRDILKRLDIHRR